MPPSPLWRVAPGSSFRWRHWDDEFVLYHDQSGDTHRLNPLGARAIEYLAEGALRAEHLAGRLATEFEVPLDDEFTATIARLVESFYDLGLVERLDDTR